jgi:hypothetical protein
MSVDRRAKVASFDGGVAVQRSFRDEAISSSIELVNRARQPQGRPDAERGGASTVEGGR